MPHIEKLQDAGLLGRTGAATSAGEALAAELRGVLSLSGDGEDEREVGVADRPGGRSPGERYYWWRKRR